jgi:hypothetical protein
MKVWVPTGVHSAVMPTRASLMPSAFGDRCSLGLHLRVYRTFGRHHLESEGPEERAEHVESHLHGCRDALEEDVVRICGRR